jgi:hypothetical protein
MGFPEHQMQRYYQTPQEYRPVSLQGHQERKPTDLPTW